MTDRTQIAFAGTRYAVPRVAKRLAEMAIGAGLTAAAMLIVLMINAALTGAGTGTGTAKRGSAWFKGYEAWVAFISRSDILATLLLTAAVTVAFVYWQRGRERR